MPRPVTAVRTARPMDVRWVGRLWLLGALIATSAACLSEPEPSDDIRVGGNATLTARPQTPTNPLAPGKHDLGISPVRDGFIYVPEGLQTDVPAPVLMLLHGATGQADNWEGAFGLADSLGVVLIAPDSRGTTWDILVFGLFGPDVEFINSALGDLFEGVTVDPTRMGVAGFSDGASYALSLGLSNGDLFTHVIAWSPGFSAPINEVGRPSVFVSHGTTDGILSINNVRNTILPDLAESGYDVRYEEFEGGHVIPPIIARQAFDWFLN